MRRTREMGMSMEPKAGDTQISDIKTISDEKKAWICIDNLSLSFSLDVRDLHSKILCAFYFCLCHTGFLVEQKPNETNEINHVLLTAKTKCNKFAIEFWVIIRIILHWIYIWMLIFLDTIGWKRWIYCHVFFWHHRYLLNSWWALVN